MKKKICMLLAGMMLAGSLGTTAFAQEEATTEPMELTMYFPVSVGCRVFVDFSLLILIVLIGTLIRGIRKSNANLNE